MIESDATEPDRTITATSSCELCGGTVINDECQTCASQYMNGKRVLDKYDKLPEAVSYERLLADNAELAEALYHTENSCNILKRTLDTVTAERDALRDQLDHFKSETLRLRKLIDPSYEPFRVDGDNHA